MIISTGEVRKVTTPLHDGRFKVYIDVLKAEKDVIYTSPYRAGPEGGFLFIPEIGTTVLVCKPDKTLGSEKSNKSSGAGEWYFLSTIFTGPEGRSENPEPIKGTRAPETMKVDKHLYRSRGVPMRNTIRSPMGHTLQFSDEYGKDPHSKEPLDNRRVELKTFLGKVLKFLDSAGQDSIYLVNEHRDGIKITSSHNDPFSAANSIEIESLGPQKIISRESQVDIWVDEGKELNLINNSTGVNEDEQKKGAYGNVNLESAYRDINLNCLHDDGRIFIQCLSGINLASGTPGGSGQLIEIQTKNETSIIRIHGKGKVEVHADGDIVMEAGKPAHTVVNPNGKKKDIPRKIGNISIVANGKIDINGQLGVNIDAGPTLPDSPVPKDINLNSGNAAGLKEDQVKPALNYYGDEEIY